MTRATRSPKPVESFGPEVLQALLEGAKREITMDLSWRKAVYFRSRINALRAEMRRQNHAMYSVVSQATVRIVWDESVPVKRSLTNVSFPASKEAPVRLVISPADSEFGEALKRAGVEVRPLSLDSVPNTGSPDTGSDILADLMKEEPNATS